MTSRGVRLACLAALMIAAAVWVLRLSGIRPLAIFSRGTGPPPSIAELAAAIGPERLHLGQLTGPWPHRPLRVSRGERDTRLGGNYSLLSKAGWLQQEVRRAPNAGTLHAYGVALLLLGEDSEATDTLEQSILQEPEAAGYHSDLSAAYLARAVSGNRPSDFVKALESAERAVTLDATLLPALFNRALALEELGLGRRAIDDWRAYVSKSRADGWAHEAQSRLARLEAPRPMDAWTGMRAQILASGRLPDRTALATFTQQARELVEDELLPRWAEDWEAGRLGPSTADLSAARGLADVLSQDTGDQLTFESVRAVEQALEQRDAPRTKALARGHREFRRLRDAYQATNATHIQDAAAAATRAAAFMREGRSPFEYWARTYLVLTSYYGGDMETSQRVCDAILAETEGKPYYALRGRHFWSRGVLLFAQTQYEEALRDYLQGVDALDRAHEVENGAAVRQQTAEALRTLGQTEASWRRYREALQRLPLIVDPVRVHALLTSVGLANLRQGDNATARYFFDAAVDNGLRGGASLLVEARLDRARALVRLGHFHEGVSDLELARTALEDVTSSRPRLDAEWLTADAEIHADRDPARAVNSASVALTRYAELNTLFRAASLLQVRGRAYARLGQTREAQADYRRGIEVIEGDRARMREQGLRVSYLDSVWDLYGRLMERLIDDGDFAGAFEVSERSRSRTLLDARGTAPSSLETLARHLDPGSTLLSFSVLDQEIVVWSVHDGATSVRRIPYDRARLRDLVSAFRTSIEEHQSNGQALRLSRQLYDLLLQPFAAELSRTTRLDVSASDSLHWVPWAALQNAGTGRFLIEDMEIELLSQASALAAGRSRRSIRADRVLIMLPRTDEGDAQRLPGASREANDIMAIWPHAVRVDGGTATRDAVLAALETASIIHFAGHAQSHPEFGRESRLFVDPRSDGSAGAVTGADILRVKSHTDLVILAACRTGYGPLSRGEGALSLGWALTVAGVEHVVATLWDIDDAASARLFVEFHKTLASTGDPAGALRASQRRLAMADPDLRSGYLWAGVVYLGG
jgi:CHAT domain-containing protein